MLDEQNLAEILLLSQQVVKKTAGIVANLALISLACFRRGRLALVVFFFGLLNRFLVSLLARRLVVLLDAGLPIGNAGQNSETDVRSTPYGRRRLNGCHASGPRCR